MLRVQFSNDRVIGLILIGAASLLALSSATGFVAQIRQTLSCLLGVLQ